MLAAEATKADSASDYYYYYIKVIFAHSYSENSLERANVKNMLSCIVQSSAGDEMT